MLWFTTSTVVWCSVALFLLVVIQWEGGKYRDTCSLCKQALTTLPDTREGFMLFTSKTKQISYSSDGATAYVYRQEEIIHQYYWLQISSSLDFVFRHLLHV